MARALVLFEKCNEKGFLKINSIGNESISFIDSQIIDKSFKKINVIVLVQKDNNVVVDEEVLPRVVVSERGDPKRLLKKRYGYKFIKKYYSRADAVVFQTNAAFNAGTTIARDTLSVVGKVETDEVYYFFTGLSGRLLRDQVKMVPISSLKKDAFFNLCTIKDFH